MGEQSHIDVLHVWDAAVKAYELKEWQKSASKFSQISVKSSRHLYNIACCEIQLKRYKQAIELLNTALTKDTHLVIAVVQRALCYHLLNWHLAAISDLEKALTLIGERRSVNYKQMGLNHKLTDTEVIYNLASVCAASHDFTKAEQWLLQAQGSRKGLGYVDEALDKIRHRKTFPPLTLPISAIFHPDQSMLANVEKKDYLGQAKVLAEVKVTNDDSALQKVLDQFLSSHLTVPNADAAAEQRSRSRDDVTGTSNDVVAKPANDVMNRNESARSLQLSPQTWQQLRKDMPSAPPPRLVTKNPGLNLEGESDVRNFALPPPPQHPNRKKELKQRSEEVRPFEALVNKNGHFENEINEKFGKEFGKLKVDNDPWKKVDEPEMSELEKALQKHRAKMADRNE